MLLSFLNNCSRNYLLKNCPSSAELPSHLCQKSVACLCMGLFLDFLICCWMLIPSCLHHCKLCGKSYNQTEGFLALFFSFFKIVNSYTKSLAYSYKSGVIVFIHLHKILLKFSKELTLICLSSWSCESSLWIRCVSRSKSTITVEHWIFITKQAWI